MLLVNERGSHFGPILRNILNLDPLDFFERKSLAGEIVEFSCAWRFVIRDGLGMLQPVRQSRANASEIALADTEALVSLRRVSTDLKPMHWLVPSTEAFIFEANRAEQVSTGGAWRSPACPALSMMVVKSAALAAVQHRI